MAEAEACVDCKPSDSGPAPAAASATSQQHNPLDPSTFVPPSPSITPSITIEFCDRVRVHIYRSYGLGNNPPYTVSMVCKKSHQPSLGTRTCLVNHPFVGYTEQHGHLQSCSSHSPHQPLRRSVLCPSMQRTQPAVSAYGCSLKASPLCWCGTGKSREGFQN